MCYKVGNIWRWEDIWMAATLVCVGIKGKCWVVETNFMHCRTIFHAQCYRGHCPSADRIWVFRVYLWMPRSSFKILKQAIFLPLLFSSPECELTHTSALLNLHFWSTWMRCQSKTRIRKCWGTVLSRFSDHSEKCECGVILERVFAPILPRLVIGPTDSSQSSITYYWWLPNLLPVWRCQHVLLQVWMHINALIIKL